MASIPLLILFDSESPDPNLNNQAWAAAFVLIMFVLVSSLTARYFLAAARAEARSAAERTPDRHQSVTAGYSHRRRTAARDTRRGVTGQRSKDSAERKERTE